MHKHRFPWLSSAMTLVLWLAGCSTQVAYVDEVGNPLAVDGRGRPVVAPEAGPPGAAPVRSAPVVAGRSRYVTGNPRQPASPPWGVVVEGEARPPAARAPVSVSRAAPAPTPAPTAVPGDLPTPDPSWQVAPRDKNAPAARSEKPTGGAGSAGGASSGKKVGSSAGLGGPPAG